MVGSIAFDGIIEGARHLTCAKGKGDSDDKVTTLFGGV